MIFFFWVKIAASQKLSLGVYEGKESHRKIALLDDKKFLLLNPTIYRDTASFGKWGRAGGFLKLDSDVPIVKDTLEMEVEECRRFSEDSVYFEIRPGVYDSPSEQQDTEPALQYRLLMEDENDLNSRSLMVPRICSFHRREFAGVKGIGLSFYPSSTHFGEGLDYTSYYTGCHYIQDKSSNYFVLNVPTLTYEYIRSKRFVGEYLRIVSDKEMEWKNEHFLLENKAM